MTDKPTKPRRTPNTYGLYQNQFDLLAEAVAYFELGFKEDAREIIDTTLAKDRKTFDEAEFQKKVNRHMAYIARARGLDLRKVLNE